MKFTFIALSLTLSINSFAACVAPSSSFYESKLKDAFMVSEAVNMVKSILYHESNEDLRAIVDGLSLNLSKETGKSRDDIAFRVNTILNEMRDNAGLKTMMPNHPKTGAFTMIKGVSETEGKLSLRLRANANPTMATELPFLTENALSKLGTSVYVYYVSPDKIQVKLSYDNKQVDLNEAIQSLQEDFEKNCKDKDSEKKDSDKVIKQ